MIAPTPLGYQPTFAIGAPFGRFEPSQLTHTDGRAIIFLHRLGGEKEREKIGPRELRESTCAALEIHGWPERWGLGGVCVELEDAGNFSIAGYTWFTFDLAPKIDTSADDATLDALDARIVALEDAGCYPIGWHQGYLEAGFDEESLARSAVKFAAALSHAEQLQQTVRTAWSGRGEFPDTEISIARALRRTTALELHFLAAELKRRGVWCSVIAPALGPHFQPGLASAEAPAIAGFAEILADAGNVRLSAPGASHVEDTDAAFFAMLRHIAKTRPSLFRDILSAAREAFPIVSKGWNLSVTEEDVHMMPTVEDECLTGTFLDHPHGRQTLLCTWDFICETLGEPIRSAQSSRT